LRIQSAISAAVTTITKTITVATPHMDGYVARGGERYRRSPHGAVGPAARRRTTVVVLLDQDSPRLGSRTGASGQEEMTAKGGSPGPQEPALSWADSAPFRVLGLLPPQQREAQENAQRRAVAAWIEASPAEPKYPLGYTFGPQLDPTILRLVRAASTRPHLAEQQLYL
jgi:hypothetical protein